MNWNFCPGDSATYVGEMVTDPLCEGEPGPLGMIAFGLMKYPQPDRKAAKPKEE